MQLKTFKYEVKTPQDKVLKGQMEAISKAICIKYLETKNYKVLTVFEHRNILTELNQITFGRLLKPKQLVFFLKQLGSLINSGVKLLTALELLSLQQEDKNIRKIYFELYQQVYNGNALSFAMSKRSKEFPNLLVQMIKIGEISGTLGETILDMGTYYEKQMKLTSDIKSAIRMPLIYLSAAILISIGMLMYVFPNITGLFQSFGDAELPAVTKFFIDTGAFFQNNSLWIFGSILIVVVLFTTSYKLIPQFALSVKKFVLHIPIIGTLIQMNNQILIANSIAQMMSHGVHALESLKTTRDILDHEVYKEIINDTIYNLQDGKRFSKAFIESPFIDPIMARMIATGESTGDLPKLMQNLSTYFNEISSLKVEQIKNSIQPLLLIIVYAIVGTMILAIMLPMLSLGSQV